jgi:pyruvate-formate lyase-activating enzyme
VSRTITVLIDHPGEHRFHRATIDALHHAIGYQADVRVDAVRTDAIAAIGHGVVVGPGSPYRDPRAAEDVIRQCRERGVPLVGT